MKVMSVYSVQNTMMQYRKVLTMCTEINFIHRIVKHVNDKNVTLQIQSVPCKDKLINTVKQWSSLHKHLYHNHNLAYSCNFFQKNSSSFVSKTRQRRHKAGNTMQLPRASLNVNIEDICRYLPLVVYRLIPI